MVLPRWVVVPTVLVSATFAIPYVRGTLRGQTKPNRLTWGLWSIAPLVAFAAELVEGVGLRSLVTFSAGAVPLTILVVALVTPAATWQLTPFDVVCGALSVAALAGWWASGSETVALTLAIAASLLAGIPTMRKAYGHPETEKAIAFLGGVLNGAVALLVLDSWSFADWAFPAYVLTTSAFIMFLIGVAPRLPGRRRRTVSSR